MFEFLKSIIWGLFRRVVVGSSAEADNLALRHQLAVLQRQIRHRSHLTRWDRLLFATLYRFQPSVLRSISIVQPETVVRWHRAGFRLFWKHKSRGKAGRPRVPGDVRALIREISIANPLWGAPRIHGELLKLGFDVSQSTVATYMVRGRHPPSQGWLTFLRNHAEAHLRRLLRAYADYYNTWRTHLGLDKDTQFGRPIHDRGRITLMPKLGGLHHAYVRI